MTEVIDGRAIAEAVRDEVAVGVKERIASGFRAPYLAVVLVGEDPASASYVKGKTRACERAAIESDTLRYDADLEESALLNVIARLNADEQVDGILVQLPLPPHINEARVIQAINPAKDVDGFHPVNVGLTAIGAGGFSPATPSGIMELLRRSGIETAGRRAVVLGRSNIVGKPVAQLLSRKGTDATVTMCHSRTRDLPAVTREADILIAAIGRPGFVKAEMVKPGATVIDVGINRVADPGRERGYRLVGDVDFDDVWGTAGHMTPVPGGVGPMTIAMLLRNTLEAAGHLASEPA